jgi:hypothetical protein
MFLKQRFDENPGSMTPAQFPKIEPITEQREIILLHNNFGICQQHRVIGITEGLGRVKSFWSNYVSS